LILSSVSCPEPVTFLKLCVSRSVKVSNIAKSA
jgi:hypothetical protein